MRFILFALVLSLLLVVALTVQTGKTWNYALLGEGTKTRLWSGSSWVDPGTVLEPMLSDTASPSCVTAPIPGSGFAVALSQPIVIQRIWINLKDTMNIGCNLVIKASATGAATNVLYSNSTFIPSGSRELLLSNSVAYKYYVIESGSTVGLYCQICGFEVFT